MKKKNILILSIVLILALMFSFAACKVEGGDNGGDEPIEDVPVLPEETEKTVFTALYNSSFTRVDIVVMQGNTLVYSKVNDVVTNPYDLDVDNVSVVTGAPQIELSESDFESPAITGEDTEKVFKGALKNATEKLGVSCSNATVEIIANLTQNTSSKMVVKYTTDKNYTFTITAIA